jgi:hypothetical protein
MINIEYVPGRQLRIPTSGTFTVKVMNVDFPTTDTIPDAHRGVGVRVKDVNQALRAASTTVHGVSGPIERYHFTRLPKYESLQSPGREYYLHSDYHNCSVEGPDRAIYFPIIALVHKLIYRVDHEGLPINIMTAVTSEVAQWTATVLRAIQERPDDVSQWPAELFLSPPVEAAATPAVVAATALPAAPVPIDAGSAGESPAAKVLASVPAAPASGTAGPVGTGVSAGAAPDAHDGKLVIMALGDLLLLPALLKW